MATDLRLRLRAGEPSDRPGGRRGSGPFGGVGGFRGRTARTLALWAATRAAVVVLWVVGAFELSTTTLGTMPPLLDRWRHWDADLFIKIAQYGYRGVAPRFGDRGVVAFFPGEPLALRAVHAVVPDWVAAGLLVSFAAGAVAVVALARLAAEEYGADAAVRAPLYLMVSPFAVFLFAGYSEALFLAFAVPAWLALRRERWVAAGVLGFVAAGVRITGVFLGIAMLVDVLVSRRGRGWREPRLLWLAGPFVATAAYFGYLRALTGRWTAWLHAETSAGWSRGFTLPWKALATTWRGGADQTQSASAALSFRVEIAMMLVGVVTTIALIWLRRFGEATYVGLQVAALATTSYYLSVGRASVVWFPLWLLLAAAAQRRRWIEVAYFAVAPALMAVYVLGFTSGAWAG